MSTRRLKNRTRVLVRQRVTSTSPLVGERLCEHCLLPKPVEEFRRRSRNTNSRMSQCRACHNASERLRRAAQRERLGRREMRKMLTALKNQQTDRQVKAICREMVERFGGVNGIVEVWGRCFERDRHVGGYATLRHVQAVLRLTEYCEQNRPDYGAMSDEELREAILALGGSLPGATG